MPYQEFWLLNRLTMMHAGAQHVSAQPRRPPRWRPPSTTASTPAQPARLISVAGLIANCAICQQIFFLIVFGQADHVRAFHP